MSRKNLTNSRLDRQNILNNQYALEAIQEKVDFTGVLFEGQLMFTREMAANLFEVDIRTISRYVESHSEELTTNGYQILKGQRLKQFISRLNVTFGKDIDVPSKTTVLGVFNFRGLLNLGMLLSESNKAKILRQMILDIVIDLINQKTGGGTKYINQRDKNFLTASLQEQNYRRIFTDVLKEHVVDKQSKYGYITDLIYQSIFREKARE